MTLFCTERSNFFCQDLKYFFLKWTKDFLTDILCGRLSSSHIFLFLLFQRNLSMFPLLSRQHVWNSSLLPNRQRWHAKLKLSRNMCTLHTRFLHARRRFCMLSRCLVNKISASELRKKSIKSALLAGSPVAC